MRTLVLASTLVLAFAAIMSTADAKGGGGGGSGGSGGSGGGGHGASAAAGAGGSAGGASGGGSSGGKGSGLVGNNPNQSTQLGKAMTSALKASAKADNETPPIHTGKK